MTWASLSRKAVSGKGKRTIVMKSEARRKRQNKKGEEKHVTVERKDLGTSKVKKTLSCMQSNLRSSKIRRAHYWT